MRRIPLPVWLTSILLYVFLYAPIAVVIVYSFNNAKYGGPWRGFTLKWYANLLDHPDKIAAAWNTIELGVASTLVSTLLGTGLGYGLSRYRFPGKRVFAWLMYIPVVIPDIVMAIAMLMFYALVREALGILELGMLTMILAHVTFQIPFVAIVVRSRLVGMDPALEEAAHDLGASSLQTFRHVTLPLILPGVVAGGMLAFTLSLDDFVISFFTSGPSSVTLPLYIYGSLRRGITPEIHALSTIVFLVTVLLVLALQLATRAPRED